VLRADLDNQYGKGTYDRLLARVRSVTTDPATGQLTSTDKSGLVIDPKAVSVTLPPRGAHQVAHIPGDDLKQFMIRYDAARVTNRQKPLFNNQFLSAQSPENG
jgi:hypothetical protein